MRADPPGVEIVNAGGTSQYVLTCEHASNFIPARFGQLGLSDHELTRHIAWDIGAAEIARHLSRLIDAPLFLAGYSRLLIDCNRPLSSPTSIPTISETSKIPGNHKVSEADKRWRTQTCFLPFHRAIEDHLNQRRDQGRQAVILGIHSFTPVYHGVARPWAAGILFRRSAEFGAKLVEALRAPDDLVAANEPYQIEDDSDYTVPVHGEARGLDAVLIEIRQDLTEGEGAARWAKRLAAALTSLSR